MKKIFILMTAISLMFLACDNFFHDLVPPSNDRIISFKVEGQTSPEIIDDNEIQVFVGSDVDITALVPVIKVSDKAAVIPVTLEYIQAAFPSINVLYEAYAMSTTNDITAYVINLIEKNKDDFSVPAIDMPINFSYPVDFLVVSAAGDIRRYSVYVGIEVAKLTSFNFVKYYNPEIVIDAPGEINISNKTITANAWYPVEMPSLSYSLIPTFEIDGGGTVEYNGTAVISGETPIQFDTQLGSQIITITVVRGTVRTDYELNVFFTEDPDTVRSITDFRFTRLVNPALAADAVGSIISSGDTGTITVQILYQGSVPPENLIPRFVSPGTVTVNGITQETGVTTQNFTAPLQYRVVSKSGQYVRVYTVVVELISITADAPKILSFRFPFGINRGIIGDAAGNINDSTEEITIQVKYSGFSAPDYLIPEFTAQGLVSVYGAVQISGSSEQDFSRQLKYTVTNPNNPILKRDYIVRCIFVRDDSSDASITAFGFYPENNRGLLQILPARVDQNTGKISLFAPIGSGITARTMYPQFSASGQVTVNGVVQRSGVNGRMFDEPVEYVVTSANGQNTRIYIVEVKELGTTIYVNKNATGLNDGTNWQNAFISLKNACEAAIAFDREVPKWIWIAAGTYSPMDTNDFFLVAPNTYYIGGFAGHEEAETQRNPAANPVIISGNPTKLTANDVHSAFFNSAMFLSGEDVYFEDITFTDFTQNVRGSAVNFTYLPISLRWGPNAEGVINIKNCKFININGPCIELSNGNVFMENVTAQRIASMYTNNKPSHGLNLVTNDYFNNIQITEQIQFGNGGYHPLFILYAGEGVNSSINITNINLNNIKLGTKIYGNNALININNYEAKNIVTENVSGGDLGSVFEIYTGAAVEFNNINIDTGTNGRSFLGSIFLNEVKGNIFFTNVTIKDINVAAGDDFGGAGGISINYPKQDGVIYRGGRVEIDNVKLLNIGKMQSPAFHIYKPSASIDMKDFTVEVRGLAYGNPIVFRSYSNLTGKTLRFKSNSNYGDFSFVGDTNNGIIEIEDLRGEFGSVSFSGSYKEVTVKDVLSTQSGLNISTSYRNVTVNNVSASGLSSSISSSGSGFVTSVTDYTAANAGLNVSHSNGTVTARNTSSYSASFSASYGTVEAYDITTTGSTASFSASYGTVNVEKVVCVGASFSSSGYSGSSYTSLITVNNVISNNGTINFSTSYGTMDAADITSNYGGISVSASYSNIKIVNAVSTKNPNNTLNPAFSVSGTRANIVMDDIKAWDFSVSSYETLKLTTARVGRSTSFTSNSSSSISLGWNASISANVTRYYDFIHKKTEIDDLKMLNPGTGFANNSMNIYSGIVDVKNSDFYVKFTEEEPYTYTDTTNTGRMIFNRYSYTNVDYIGMDLEVKFTDCNFYDFSTYRVNPIHYYNFMVNTYATLKLTRCYFEYINNPNNHGLIRVRSGAFDLDAVTIKDYNYSATPVNNYLLNLSYYTSSVYTDVPSPTSGKIKSNCIYNGGSTITSAAINGTSYIIYY